MEGDRLQSDLVAQAAAWVKVNSLPRPETAAEVAGRLMELYFDLETTVDSPVVPSAADDDLVAHLDAPGLHERIRGDLDEPLLQVLARRIQGASLGVIAAENDIATSTAHDRVVKAVKVLRRRVQQEQLRREHLEPVMEALGR